VGALCILEHVSALQGVTASAYAAWDLCKLRTGDTVLRAYAVRWPGHLTWLAQGVCYFYGVFYFHDFLSVAGPAGWL